MEINLYQIDDLVTKSLAPLLIKILEEKNKAFIYCQNSMRLKEIDDSLWSYGKNKFIPHATIADKEVLEFGFERQSIFLSTEEKNLNKAQYLVLLNEASDNFLKEFSRIFYFYDLQDLSNIKKFAKQFEKVNSYKKEDGKWVKAVL